MKPKLFIASMNLNVGTIGHVDHSKSTLAAAILAVQMRASSLRKASLPVLDVFDPKSKPEQAIVRIIDQSKEVEELVSIAEQLEQTDSKQSYLKYVPEWNHPWPPGCSRKQGN